MREQVEEIADRLYALPPRRFVDERAAAIAEARQAGDAETAAALRKLRRPTVAAWLVNLLALRRPELLADLGELATALLAAQRQLDGEQLRELTGRRREVISALVATARSLAREAAPELGAGALPVAEVEGTLAAALSDPEVAQRVRSGRLVRPVTPEGLGTLPPPRLRLITGGRAAPADGGAVQPDPAGPHPDESTLDDPGVGDEEAEWEREQSEARAALEAATEERDRAVAGTAAAQRALEGIEAELAALASRRAEAAQVLADAQAAAARAREAVVKARRRLGEVSAVLEARDGTGSSASNT